MLSLNRFASNRSVFRPVTTFFSAVAVSASLLLAGCGGGSLDVGVGVDVVVPPPAPVAAFDLILRVNGQLIDAVNVFPNELQKVDIPVGSNFEIASSGPVAWTVVTGKLVVNPLVGGRLVYQGVSVAPKFISNARYAADTEQVGPVPYPVVISFIATSLSDARQIGQIDIALTN
jgi:hypothetical protein